MIIDLNHCDSARVVNADIGIVGAGIAGLLLATRLCERGMRVALLESGGVSQSEDTHPYNQVIQLGADYKGATHGRFRCLGGTSSRWGGALLPFSSADFSERPGLSLPRWPVDYEEIIRFLPQVEELFELNAGAFDEEFVHACGASRFVPTGDPDFKARFAKWPAFHRRNVFQLLGNRIERNVDIFINATVTGFALNSDSGRLSSVTARDPGGKSVEVRATHFALCAGAIESTRLLLLLDAQHGRKLFAPDDVLGRYFHDHVSAPACEIKATNPTRLNRLAGFRFDGGTMRSLRYELSRSAQDVEGIGSAFGHITFESEGSGFDALRTLLRGAQQRGGIAYRDVAAVLGDVPYLARAAYWRYVNRQLCWPRPARYHLHIVIEQPPRARNQISLANEKDVFGLPRAAIDWQLDDEDRSAFDVCRRRFLAFWARTGLTKIGSLERLSNLTDNQTDIFHPGGSTRMGATKSKAVVDADLHTFAVPNLSVASTSTFPTGASANPTLMLMLFTERLARSLVSKH